MLVDWELTSIQFYPSHNPEATDEILIWLNGGPGCSSLEGLLQENGVFLWQYGTHRPVENPYVSCNTSSIDWRSLTIAVQTWVNLTNVVWIEQPAGTGFSKKHSTPAATNEVEVADQFLGFWKNFVDTFSLHNRKVYITGESYAGYYVPYIADAMHNKSDTTYYGIESIMFYDPSTSYDVVQQQIPAVPMVESLQPLFNFNDSYMADIRQRADECGYTEFMETAMTFPPTGPLPTPPQLELEPKCDLWNEIISAAMAVNPCWDVYAAAVRRRPDTRAKSAVLTSCRRQPAPCSGMCLAFPAASNTRAHGYISTAPTSRKRSTPPSANGPSALTAYSTRTHPHHPA